MFTWLLGYMNKMHCIRISFKCKPSLVPTIFLYIGTCLPLLSKYCLRCWNTNCKRWINTSLLTSDFQINFGRVFPYAQCNIRASNLSCLSEHGLFMCLLFSNEVLLSCLILVTPWVLLCWFGLNFMTGSLTLGIKQNTLTPTKSFRTILSEITDRYLPIFPSHFYRAYGLNTLFYDKIWVFFLDLCITTSRLRYKRGLSVFSRL